MLKFVRIGGVCSYVFVHTDGVVNNNKTIFYFLLLNELGMGHDFRIFYLIIEYRLGCAIIF